MSPKGINQFGKDNYLDFVAHRCIGSCTEDLAVVPTETNVRLWSNPNSWPSGEVPKEGEDVHVEPGWNMTMDLRKTPNYRLIRINGILNFKRGIDIEFNAKHIFVRAGELNIGSKEEPFTNNVVINL